MGVLRDSISTVAHVLGSFSHLLLPSTGLVLSHNKLNNKSRKEGNDGIALLHFDCANFVNPFTRLA